MKKSIFLLLSGLFFFGCKSSTDPTSVPVYFTSADTSIYSYQYIDVKGQITNQIADTIFIVSADTLNHPTQFKLSNGDMITLDSNGSGRISQYFLGASLCFIAKIPGKNGDTLSWQSVPIKVNGTAVFGFLRFIARNQDSVIAVPAGTFLTAVYELNISLSNDPNPRSIGLMFISRTVGLVAEEQYELDPSTNNLYHSRSKQLKMLIKK